MDGREVTFIFSSEEGAEPLKVSKEPLLRNVVFQAMLGGEFLESMTGRVDIPNIKRKLFELVIQAALEPPTASSSKPLGYLTLEETFQLMEALHQYSLNNSQTWVAGVARLKDIFARVSSTPEYSQAPEENNLIIAISILDKLEGLGIPYSVLCKTWPTYFKFLQQTAKREGTHDIMKGMLLEDRKEIPSIIEKILELAIRNQRKAAVKVILSLLRAGMLAIPPPATPTTNPPPSSSYLYASLPTMSLPAQPMIRDLNQLAFPRKQITMACLLGVGWPVLKQLVRANGGEFPLEDREAVFALRKNGPLLAKVAKKYGMWHHCLLYGHLEFLPILYNFQQAQELDNEGCDDEAESLLKRAVRVGAPVGSGMEKRNRVAGFYVDLQKEEDYVTLKMKKNGIVTGDTLLMVAARKGYLEVCKWLLHQGGADVNQRRGVVGGAGGVGGVGATALHCATAKGHWEVVEYLLETGAFADTWDEHHLTPVDLLHTRKRRQQQQQLQQHSQRDDYGGGPLLPAVSVGGGEVERNELKRRREMFHKAVLGARQFSSPFALALMDLFAKEKEKKKKNEKQKENH